MSSFATFVKPSLNPCFSKIASIIILCTSAVGCGGSASEPSTSTSPTPPKPPVAPAPPTTPQPANTVFANELIANNADANLCIHGDANHNVSLAQCNANDDRQLWSLTKDTQLLRNKNLGLCIQSQGLTLNLAKCDKEQTEQIWHYQQDQFSQNGYTFDLDVANQALILYPTHGGLNQKWLVPSLASKVIAQSGDSALSFPAYLTGDDEEAIRLDTLKDALNRLASLDKPLPYPRAVDDFPGAVNSDKRVRKTLQLDLSYYEPNHPGWPQNRLLANTGLYAAANEVITINLTNISAEAAENLYAIINIHTDKLSPSSHNVATSGRLDRYGNVTTKVALKPGENKLRSQYGGQIIIESNSAHGETITVDIANAVTAPYFKLGVHTNSQWPSIRQSDAPWGVLEGNNVVLDISKHNMQQVDDPIALLEHFDKVVSLTRYLAGFDADATEGVHQMPTLKQRLVEDRQISAGFAHAGHPIMTSPGWRLFDVNSVADNGWGNWHEIGHNHQQFCLWSQTFGTESTVNLFSLYVQRAFIGQSRIIQEQRYSNAIAKLNSITHFNFQVDADVWDKLVFFMQIIHAYPDQGFDIVRRLNRHFREMNLTQQHWVCANPSNSFDTTFELLSDIVQQDLTEHFQTWGVPVSPASYSKVANLYPKPSIDISAINPELKR